MCCTPPFPSECDSRKLSSANGLKAPPADKREAQGARLVAPSGLSLLWGVEPGAGGGWAEPPTFTVRMASV